MVTKLEAGMPLYFAQFQEMKLQTTNMLLDSHQSPPSYSSASTTTAPTSVEAVDVPVLPLSNTQSLSQSESLPLPLRLRNEVRSMAKLYCAELLAAFHPALVAVRASASSCSEKLDILTTFLKSWHNYLIACLEIWQLVAPACMMLGSLGSAVKESPHKLRTPQNPLSDLVELFKQDYFARVWPELSALFVDVFESMRKELREIVFSSHRAFMDPRYQHMDVLANVYQTFVDMNVTNDNVFNILHSDFFPDTPLRLLNNQIASLVTKDYTYIIDQRILPIAELCRFMESDINILEALLLPSSGLALVSSIFDTILLYLQQRILKALVKKQFLSVEVSLTLQTVPVRSLENLFRQARINKGKNVKKQLRKTHPRLCDHFEGLSKRYFDHVQIYIGNNITIANNIAFLSRKNAEASAHPLPMEQ